MPLAADNIRRGCPYLGLDSDWATHYPYPHDRHRCYAYRLPAQISEGRQRFYCLSDQPHLCPQRVVQAHQENTVAAAAGRRRIENPSHGTPSKPHHAGARIAVAGLAGSVALLGILLVSWIWILRGAANPGSLRADTSPRVAASMPENPPEPPPGVVLGTEPTMPAVTARATAPAFTPSFRDGMALPGGSAPVPTPVPSVATPVVARLASPSASPVPHPSISPPPTAPRTHVVEAGDNVFRLAQEFGVTVEQIARANNLDERYVIRRGQVLVIP